MRSKIAYCIPPGRGWPFWEVRLLDWRVTFGWHEWSHDMRGWVKATCFQFALQRMDADCVAGLYEPPTWRTVAMTPRYI